MSLKNISEFSKIRKLSKKRGFKKCNWQNETPNEITRIREMNRISTICSLSVLTGTRRVGRVTKISKISRTRGSKSVSEIRRIS